MNANAWFYGSSFNGRLTEEKPQPKVRILGCKTNEDGSRTVTTQVEGQLIELGFGKLDRIPCSEQIIREATKAWRFQ